MQPVGLLGEVRITALVLGVMAALSFSGSIWKALSSVGSATGTPRHSRVMDSYRLKAGVGMITSSPGLSTVLRLRNRPSVAPMVKMISSGE